MSTNFNKIIIPTRILSDWIRVVASRIFMVWVSAVVVFLCIDAFEHLKAYGEAGASTAEIVVYFLLNTPETALQILPAAVLLGSLIAMYALAKNRELTAAEAAGLHPGWVYAAPLFVGGVLIVAQLWLETGVLPELRAAADRFYTVKIERDLLKTEQPVRWTIQQDYLWRLEHLPDGQLNIERYQTGVAGMEVIRARDVQYQENTWQFKKLERIAYPEQVSPTAIRVLEIPFLRNELQPVKPSLRHLNLMQLWRQSRQKSELTEQTTAQSLELHQRLSWIFMSLTVLFAILPYVPRHGRRANTAAGILIALVIGMAGWAIIVFGTALATTEKVVSGFWLPHVFLLLTGLAGSTRIRAILSAITNRGNRTLK